MAAGNDAKIGGAYFELEARIGKLESDLKLAHQMVTANTEVIATQFDLLANRTEKSSDTMAAGIKRAIAPVREFHQAINALIGVVTTSIGLIATWGYGFVQYSKDVKAAKERTEELATTIGKITGERQRLEFQVGLTPEEQEIEKAKNKINDFYDDLRDELYKNIMLDQPARTRLILQAGVEQEAAVSRAIEEIRTKYSIERFKKEREAVDKADAEARDKREQDAKDRAGDAVRIADQAKELADAIGDIQSKWDTQRLEMLKRQTQELLKQQAILQDLQQRQIGSFGLGGMEATLKAIRGDLQSIRGVIR